MTQHNCVPVNTESAVYARHNAVLVYLAGRGNVSSQKASRLLMGKHAQ